MENHKSLHQTSKDKTKDLQRRLRITNLPYCFQELELHRLFRPFGEVAAVEMIYDPRTGSKGLGFVSMERVEDADRAYESLQNFVIGGRVVTVTMARHASIFTIKI